mgnify:FL=1
MTKLAKKPEPYRLSKEAAKVLQLRIAGKTYARIAEETGISIHSCRKHLGNLMKSANLSLDLEELVYLELERLDHLTSAVWLDAMSGSDKAVSSVLRIMERRSKLMGLDAPVRHELSGPGGGAINIANWAEFVVNDYKSSDLEEGEIVESDTIDSNVPAD